MNSSTIATDWWPIELEGMPHFETAMKRVYAWYEKVQATGRATIVDLQPDELDDFIAAVRPEGIYLWMGVDDEEEQLAILRRLEQWT